MQCTYFIVALLFSLGSSSLNAQSVTPVKVDSFQLQRATLQDTFLLRVIPKYIQARASAPGEVNFQTKGVLVVIVPRIRGDSTVRYLIHTEYDNYGLYSIWKFSRPLFYTQVAGRYVVVCDEWTGALMPIANISKQEAIEEFARSGWLNLVSEPAEGVTEIHSGVYTWRRRKE